MPPGLRVECLIRPSAVAAFPLGARGERPVAFTIIGEYRKALITELLKIPGVRAGSGGVECAWDAAGAVAAVCGIDPPEPPMLAPIPLPGIERYKALGFPTKLRDYQKEMVKYLARRAWAINALPMRSGKSAASLAAAEIVGSRRTLIICPALAKWVWADEIRKWSGQTSLVLEGRAADEARLICLACAGSGRNADGTRCPECRAKNGSTYGYKLFSGPEEVRGAIDAARWVIVNPDLLVTHRTKTAAGVKFAREDLPGWAGTLARSEFDLALADEVQLYLCGRSDLKNKGQTRRDRCVAAIQPIPRVWAVTGTPFRGAMRDAWGIFDTISDGLYGRPHFTFDVHHCNGHKGEYGWENDGRENEQELVERMRVFMLKRSRAEILKDQPRKVRQVIHLDVPVTAGKLPAKAVLDKKGALHTQLRRTAAIKAEHVVENVVQEMAADKRNKCFVLTYLVDNALDLGTAFGKVLDSREWGPRLRAVDTRIWCVTGKTDSKARFEQAKAFREWPGSGVFVATIDSMQVAISLEGAQSVHFADLTWEPHELLQAEDRPFAVGVKGLTILYYIVKGSVDEHVESLVIPKMGVLEDMTSEQGAKEFREAFSGGKQEDLAEQIWARMQASAVREGA